MFRIVFNYIHDAVTKRVTELKAADSSIDEDQAYSTILNALECDAVSLDDLPKLTLVRGITYDG